MEEDSDIPMLLGRPFLATGRTLIDVQRGELTMCVHYDQVTFNILSAMKFSNDEESCFSLNAITGEDDMQLLAHHTTDALELSLQEAGDESFEEIVECIMELNALPTYRRTFHNFESFDMPEKSKTLKPSIEEPPELELKQLPEHLKYVFLGENVTLPVIISSTPSVAQEEKLLPVQCVPKKGGITVVANEKNKLIPTRTVIGCRRCMMAIFSDMVEQGMEVFMDDFSVLEGIILGHKVSRKGLEVDRVKLETIEKLPPPSSVKGIQSFLGHAGFYRRFIKDFSKISKPLCNLLEKDVKFIFDVSCLAAYEELKMKLIYAPIIIAPNWSLPFELMCDASDFALEAVLGQQSNKIFHSVYYASKTLSGAHLNYTTTEKELLAVVRGKRLLQLNELEEFRFKAYENNKIYKKKMKKWHDQKIVAKELKPGQLVLLFNSRLKLFPEKLKSRWSGPFKIVDVSPFGAVEVEDMSSGRTSKVNIDHSVSSIKFKND
ncbi:hypothetical protein AgCh_016672 [Apium graveolens]